MSKERDLLERISDGEMSYGPRGNVPEALARFQLEAEDLVDALDWLVMHNYIGGYKPHAEAQSGKGYVDRILITRGLTLKGQDKSQWPE